MGEPYAIVWWVMGGSVSQPMCTMNDAEVCQEATMGQRHPPPHRVLSPTGPAVGRGLVLVELPQLGVLFWPTEKGTGGLYVPYAHKAFGPSTPRTKICGSKGLSRARVDLSRERPPALLPTKKAACGEQGLLCWPCFLAWANPCAHWARFFCRRHSCRRLFATSPSAQPPRPRKNHENPREHPRCPTRSKGLALLFTSLALIGRVFFFFAILRPSLDGEGEQRW